MKTEECKKEFIKILKSVSMRHDHRRVFDDFVEMSAISIRNAFLKSDKLEQQYLNIAKTYNKKEINEIPKLFALTTMALENLDSDFLGEVFMELGFGDVNKGQFFTPFNLSKMISGLTFKGLEQKLEDKEFVTVSDPACGSGGIIIALVSHLMDKGINYQKCIHASLVDVHRITAYMCYIQMSLLHVPAIVTVGNTLTLQVSENLYTPAHYMGFWDSKLKESRKIKRIKLKIKLKKAVKTKRVKLKSKGEL